MQNVASFDQKIKVANGVSDGVVQRFILFVLFSSWDFVSDKERSVIFVKVIESRLFAYVTVLTVTMWNYSK